MTWAETNHSLTDNQYGGRKGVQAQSSALNKTLSLDIIRYYAEPASIIDNDAQAYYDRILIILLSYALLMLGLPVHLVRFQCNWLRDAQYKLKLHDRLTTSYYSTPALPLQGTGKVTGWSPPNWRIVSDLITRAMDQCTPGIKLVHPDRSSMHRTVESFVDDTNSGLTTDAHESLNPPSDAPVPKMPTIQAQTAVNVQFYSDLLTSTGGKLALHKSYVYLLQTQWKKVVRKYAETQKTLPPFKIQQQSTQHDLHLLSPTETRKMLGVYTAPDGNSRKQALVLRKHSERWSQSLSILYLHQYEALLGYHHGIMKTLEYPLGASLITKIQCDHAQSPALKKVLQKSGIVSTISRYIVHGPSKYCGLNFSNLFTESGIQKVRLLLGHIRKNDKTGSIIKVALGCTQQEIGITKPFLTTSLNSYGYLSSNSWMTHLW